MMKAIHLVAIILIVMLIVALILFFVLGKPSTEGQLIDRSSMGQGFNSIIRIANWNVQVFGQSKASRPELMAKYVAEIDKNDIIEQN